MPPPLPGATLADRVAATRHRHFVGRVAELDLFRAALAAADPPFAVLVIHGPGGMGKSTLLTAYHRLADAAGLRVIALDARALDPTPAGVLAALRLELGIPGAGSPFEILPRDQRLVLLIDTFELLAPLESWLREEMLPRLPADSLTVLAGRHPLDRAWRTAPGWDTLTRAVPLRNLAPDESRRYLRGRGVAGPHVDRALAFTHGHPLALSLVADLALRTDAPFDPANDPDIVRTLLEMFVQQEPSPHHRRALEIAAHARITTESLLVEMFGEDEGHRLFAWLQGLSFMDRSGEGIYPHDLVRDVIEADLRWRHPDRFLSVHREVHRYLIQCIRRSQGRAQQQALQSLMFLHRNNPVWKPYHADEDYGQTVIDQATAADESLILDMVRRHEGEASAAIARHWFARQPRAFMMVRNLAGETTGFLARVMLDEAGPEDRAADPAVSKAFAFMDAHGAARPGERIPFIRFVMGNTTYRTPSTPMSLSTTTAAFIYTQEHLAWLLMAVAEPEYWTEYLNYVDAYRAPEADFDVDGRAYAMFAHDWRVEPIEVLDEILTAREVSTERHLDAAPRSEPPLVVLSRTEFAATVREALRAYARPGGLATNPLLRSRLVRNHADGQPAEERLRALIRAGVETLNAGAKTARYGGAVEHTYLSPATTQERAAELLDVPFSTYRRHLSSGIDLLTAYLWQLEIDPGA